MNPLAGLLLPLVLLPAAPVPAERKFDADAAAKAVAPFLDDRSFAVVHLDLTRLDVPAVADWFAKLARLTNDDVAEPKKFLGGLAQALKKAGAQDVFLVASLADERDPAFSVIPLGPGADDEKIAAVLAGLLKKDPTITSTVLHNCLVTGGPETLRGLKALKAEARPEVAKAFAAAGDGVAHGVLFAGPDLRKLVDEKAPALPKELGGGSVKVLTGGLKWVAFTVEAPPKFRFHAVAQASDADAAKELAALAGKAAKALAALDFFSAGLPDAEKLFQRFLPKADGDRLTLTVDEPALASLVVPGVELTRLAARRTTAANNLRQFGIAMHNYLNDTGRFPAVAVFDKQNKPLLSWRVHLLPYLGDDEAKLYKEFKLDEPWDSDHNKKLIAKMPRVFASPYNPKLAEQGKTTYLAPVHKDAFFTGDKKGIGVGDVPDGFSNTLMLVDVDDDHAVIWTKPDELKLDPKDPHKGLSARHGGKYLVLFADGSTRLLPKLVEKETLWAIFTRNGGEVVNLP
jgi:hypothetical protein